MAFDIQKWLVDDLKFTVDEATALLPQFQTRADTLEKGQLRQADYSRQMNDITRLQTDLKTNSDRLNREMAEWAEIRAQDSDAAKTAREQLEKTQLEKFQLEQALQRVAEQAGIDPRTVLPGGPPTPPKPPEPQKPEPFDPKPIMQTVGSIADYLLGMQAELPAIMAEHQALTGEHLDTRKFIEEVKARAAKKEDVDPRRLWETLYEIPQKRDAKRQTDYDTAIRAAEARGREAARSEAAIPGTTAPGHAAPIFTRMGENNQPPVSKFQRPNSHAAVAEFARSIATHKYRQPGTAPAEVK